MIITIKTLQQETITVDIEKTSSVKELKEKINSMKGPDYPVQYQKLIYSGKILEDDSKLSEHNIDSKKFLVVMVSKPKVSATSEASSAGPSKAPDTAADQPSTSKAAAETESKPTGKDKETVEESKTQKGQSGHVIENYESIVKNIMDMGYPRNEVERALRAGFFNPDRAVEYLINGIPDDLGNIIDQVTEHSNPLDFLRNQPQFNQMRAVVQNNPELLNNVLQQIGQQNPELLQVISQNQDLFVRMLNEPYDEEAEESTGPGLLSMPAPAAPLGGAAAGGTGAQGGSSVIQLPSGDLSIQMTNEDRAAIERLKDMGFPEMLVIQAYFACEKNENMAANFLLSHMDDAM